MQLAPSTKARLLMQSLKTIKALEQRLTTCSLDDFAAVKTALLAEKEAFATLEGVQVKPRRTRGAR